MRSYEEQNVEKPTYIAAGVRNFTSVRELDARRNKSRNTGNAPDAGQVGQLSGRTRTKIMA